MATIRQIQESLKPRKTKQKIGRGRMVLSVSELYNPRFRRALMLPVFQQPGLPEKVFWTPSQHCQFYKDRPQPGDQFIGDWTLYWDPVQGGHIIQTPGNVKRGKLGVLSTEGEQASDSWYFTAEDGSREWLGACSDLKFAAPRELD